MKCFRVLMAISWVLIMALTIHVVSAHGLNWPVVFIGDLFEFNWRSQFYVDFSVLLLILFLWINWREASTMKGLVCGLLSVFMGGMFAFAYLVYESYVAKGNVKAFLLGAHYRNE
ncbi:hypothetical protein [Leucothrix pacifica]|uniref:DUF1475 domain-containing protein n=1 Tax=Leucothrix pacifica TaxID=1247513 RepID=A0A317CNI1_9GAMM|nr:hypothetical protein [Leucothrix pacifica]PWQ99747.1 hypothetical protein DKW60_04530 [Leucothrix pacifica]